MTDIIKGVSYLNSTIETNPTIIKKNKIKLSDDNDLLSLMKFMNTK